MGENSGREYKLSNTERIREQFTKIVTSKEQGTSKGEHNTKRYVLFYKNYDISFPSKQSSSKGKEKECAM